MMSLEGPFLAAVIARLPDPTFNLAAYGVAFALAILVESPVIMLMSASTALVEDETSYRRLRVFMLGLNGISTLLLVVLAIPAVFGVVIVAGLGLPEPVAEIVYGSLWLLLPWPAAIGYRRFLHGLLIRSGRTRLVAVGTLIRVTATAGTALALARTALPGAWIGAAALSAGVVVEAVTARVMAAGAIRDLTGRADDSGRAGVACHEVLGYSAIARFYYPLALTSLIGLAVQPLLTFFMGRSPSPVESLALFPVVISLCFFFNALGLSYQEAAIALLGRDGEHAPEIRRFAAWLAVASSGGLALIAFTPLAEVWYGTVSGLPDRLAELAITPTRILVLVPALGAILAFQRAVLVNRRTTRPITVATIIEVVGIAAIFPLVIWRFGTMGVVAAAVALLGGRIASVIYMTKKREGRGDLFAMPSR